jgi:hypothetical protein
MKKVSMSSEKDTPTSQFKSITDYARELPAPSRLHSQLIAELAPRPVSGTGRAWVMRLLLGLVCFLLLAGIVFGTSAYKSSSDQLTTLDARVIALSTQLAVQPTQTPIPTETPTLEPTEEIPPSPISSPMPTIVVNIVSTISPNPITFVYALSPTVPLAELREVSSSVLQDPSQKRITLWLDDKPADHLFQISATGQVWPILGVLTETLPLTETLQVAVDGGPTQELIQIHMVSSLPPMVIDSRFALRPLDKEQCSNGNETTRTNSANPVQVLGRINAWNSSQGKWVPGFLVWAELLSDPQSHALRCVDQSAFGSNDLATINTTSLPDFSIEEIRKLLPNEAASE